MGGHSFSRLHCRLFARAPLNLTSPKQERDCEETKNESDTKNDIAHHDADGSYAG